MSPAKPLFSLDLRLGQMGFEANMKRERAQSGMEDAQDGEPSDAFPSEPNPSSVRRIYL